MQLWSFLIMSVQLCQYVWPHLNNSPGQDWLLHNVGKYVALGVILYAEIPVFENIYQCATLFSAISYTPRDVKRLIKSAF